MADATAVELEIVFPESGGPAVYTWKARLGQEWRTSQDVAADPEGGTFADGEAAAGDLAVWLGVRRAFFLPMPEEMVILRAKPEVYALVHVK